MSNLSIEDIAERHGICLLLQFGSTISGNVHPRSDVDLAVLLNRPPLSFEEHADLLHDLQTLCLDREVDLVLLNRADPLLLKKIMESFQLLFGSARRLQEFRIYAFRRYQDHRKYLDLERDFVHRTLNATASS